MPDGSLNIGDSRRIWNSSFKVNPNAKGLKRTGFKSRTSPLKRSPFKRKSTLDVKVSAKVHKKGPKLEAWIKAVPESQAHGSGTLQKRLWRLKSDFVRIRDWYSFDGECVATGVKIGHWSQGQAGHLKPYSKCNGMFKFHEMNIHMQSAQSNKWGNRDDWKAYEAELERRYSDQFVPAIELSNKNWPLKFTNEQLIAEMRRTIKMLGTCREQPEYYPRVISLLTQLEHDL